MKATTTKKLFSRETQVSIDIASPAAAVWQRLTNAADFPRWNSTVISIEGRIAQGETIRLKAKLDPKRTFKLKVKELVPNQRLVWGDAMGERVYTLTEQNGVTTFHMRERIGGPLFPLFASMIPSFDEAFDQYAADLKRASENWKEKGGLGPLTA